MNNQFSCPAVPLIVSLVILFAVPHSAPCVEFSADLIRSSGGESDRSKVYLKGDLRREETFEDGELSAVTIFRPDKRVTWNLMPEDEMYMEVPLVEGMDGAEGNIDKLENSTTVEILGEETVNGFVCEKRLYGGSDEAPGEVVAWYSKELDYPVKLQISFLMARMNWCWSTKTLRWVRYQTRNSKFPRVTKSSRSRACPRDLFPARYLRGCHQRKGRRIEP